MQKIVFERKMVPLKEFLDETDETEIQLYIENIVYSGKIEQECARMVSYYNLLPNMKKGFRKSPEDVIPLITDTYDIYSVKQEFDANDYEETKKRLDAVKAKLDLDSIFNKNNN